MDADTTPDVREVEPHDKYPAWQRRRLDELVQEGVDRAVQTGSIERAPHLSQLHDSGKREQFDGGAQRDTAEGKPKFSLLSPHAWVAVHPTYGLYVRNILLNPSNTNYLENLLLALLEHIGIARLCNWLELGAKKYSRFNWAKGMPLSRCIDSLGRHLDKAQRDVEDGEDHLAAAACNVMFLLHYCCEIQAGRMDAKWNDLDAVPWRAILTGGLPPEPGLQNWQGITVSASSEGI